jgi:hypothetical protein
MGNVTALKKKKEEFSLDDILSSAQTTKEKSSSTKVPILTVSKETQEKVSRIRELKDQLDSLTSEFEVVSAEVIEEIDSLRMDVLKKQGYSSSVKVPDSKGMSIMLSWSANYSKVPIDNKDALKLIAKDRFEGFFGTEIVIKVKDVSEESLKELVSTVGPEQFARFFEVERWIKPTKRYTEEFVTAFTDAEREKLSAIVKQYKPSIKVK